MFKSFQDIPIRRKMTQVIMIAGVVTLLLAFGILYQSQRGSVRRTVERDLRLQAEIIAEYSEVALGAQDPQAANKLLLAFNSKPHVVAAGLYLPSGDALAFWGYADADPSRLSGSARDGMSYEGQHLVIYQPVLRGDERIGTLYLRFNYQMMEGEIVAPFPLIMTTVLLATTVVAIVLSLFLQRVVSEPVLRLTDTALEIAGNQDYSVRARAWGRDEIGTLTAAFNQMLARIHEQDGALRRSEARYRLLFESNSLPMFVYDEATTGILAVNDAAVRHYGYGREEFLKLKLDDLETGATSASTGAGDAAGATAVRTGTHRRRDGVQIQVEVTTHLIEFSGHRARLALCNDITARLLADERAARAYDELEARVKERTHELSQAKQAAEAASQTKSRFLAVMSHEIRTPLNGVTGVLRLLRRDPLTPQQARWIEMALASADTLLRVINDILDFSKVEAGKLDLRLAAFELAVTVQKAVGSFVESAGEKGLRCRVEMDAALPVWVVGDPGRLVQVLGNLLGNAIKFTDRGHVTVQVEKVPGPGDRTWVRFVVTDTGVGISPAQLGDLFKPFSQLDNSSTRRHGGTGLGLGICKQLVELMGGTLNVSSKEGLGSRFWFDLPFLSPAQPGSEGGTPDASPPAPGGIGSVVGAGRVLLAEDNEVNQELAREMIQSAGCVCDCVANGTDAIRAARQGTYQLVFMDCMMPETDGYAATRAIREEEARSGGFGAGGRRLPIVAMTANAMRGDRERCLAAGMDDYLSKPLDPDAVGGMVRKWLVVPTEGTASTPERGGGS